MNILFLTDNFPPEVNAPASRTYEHAVRWVAAGAKVTVITGAPNFPQGKVYSGYRNRLFGKENINGIEVIRVWTFITANEGFIKRSIDYLSFAFSAFIAGLFCKADVIVATSPQFFTTFAGSALGFLRRKPWIFELRDLWPESLVAVGATHNSTLISLLERIEMRLYRHSARVIAVTPSFKANLVARGIPPEKVEVVTNGADLTLWQPRPIDEDIRTELKLAGKFVVGYIGTHGMAHALDFIVRAAAKVQDPRLHFLFIGDGAEKASIVELAGSLGLTNVSFLPSIPKQDVPRYLASTDVALVPLRRSDTFKTVIPSKIFEAAAMNKPILLGVEGQAEEIVREFNAGPPFAPEDEADFLDKLHQLATDTETYRAYQAGCANLAIAYDRNRLADKMLNIISYTAKNHRRDRKFFERKVNCTCEGDKRV